MNEVVAGDDGSWSVTGSLGGGFGERWFDTGYALAMLDM